MRHQKVRLPLGAELKCVNWPDVRRDKPTYVVPRTLELDRSPIYLWSKPSQKALISWCVLFFFVKLTCPTSFLLMYWNYEKAPLFLFHPYSKSQRKWRRPCWFSSTSTGAMCRLPQSRAFSTRNGVVAKTAWADSLEANYLVFFSGQQVIFSLWTIPWIISIDKGITAFQHCFSQNAWSGTRTERR